MARGGARNRSGPSPDPNSSRSDARGLRFDALPAEGFQGEAPEFPFAGLSDREAEKWASLWRTPQAAAWIREPWRWDTVAMYCRWSVACESPDAPSSALAQIHRLGDQIGMTPAGLRENGWSIARDEVAERRESRPAAASEPPRRRLRAVGDQ